VKEFWIYTGLRIALFLAFAAVVWGVYAILADTINLLVVVLVAAVLSSLLSWKLLATPRKRFAASVEARAHRIASKFDEAKAREDVD
jgi:peptidoglycan/LPS O-acetylase OafA/YrhL